MHENDVRPPSFDYTRRKMKFVETSDEGSAMMRFAMLFCCFALVLFATRNAAAQEPGWSGKVFLHGETKAQKDATPIEFRSYRPFHFYGNTVRRRYYRRQVLPLPRDLAVIPALIRRR